MSLDVLPFIYVATLLLGLAAVALFDEIRRRRFEPTSTADHVFRCEKCAFVYTDDADVDRSRCPQCGTENDRFEF